MRITALTAVLLLGLTACPPAEEPPPIDEDPTVDALTVPNWMQVNEDQRTVTIDLVAGSTSANNYWNFNGYYGGQGHVTVPEGYEVTINLRNEDPNMGHSLGVGERQAQYPANFTQVTPAFEGAVTPNPTSMTESTMPGETDSFTFTADRSGEYALICYVVGHAANGMWIPFTISGDGEVGYTR